MGIANITQTITRDLIDLTGSKKSVTLETLRSQINFAKRKIINLQNELQALKSAQKLVLQNMNRFTKLEDIEHYYEYDRFQSTDPVAAAKPFQTTPPDPDPRVNWTRNRLTEGMEPLNAECNRLGSDIQRKSQEIQKQWQILSEAQAKLQQMNEGQVAIETSIAKDGLTKRTYTETYMLYEINQQAKKIAISGEEMAYSYDPGLIQQQSRLRNMFRYYALRNPYVTDGTITLDLDNPEADQNTQALNFFLDRVRQVAADEKFTNYDEKTKHYTQQMIGNVNDDFISQNVARQADSDRVPEPDSAFRNITKNLSKTLNDYVEKIPGIKTYISWDQTSFINALSSSFQKQTSDLYAGMPYCTPPSPVTPADTSAATAQLQNQYTDTSSAIVFATQFLETKPTVDYNQISAILTNLINSVNDSVKNPEGGEIYATTVLKVANITYTAANMYQVRVLNTARRVIDSYTNLGYLDEQRTEGNITLDQYNFWKESLVRVLSKANPPIIQT